MRGRMLSGEAHRVLGAMGEDEKWKLGSDKSLDYSNKYDSLLQDLTSLETPEECYTFRDYMKDYLTISSKAWMEYYLFFSLAEESHWSQAQSYERDANRLLALAYGEGERLGKKHNFNPIGDVIVADD